jgi:hypothetical protein
MLLPTPRAPNPHCREEGGGERGEGEGGREREGRRRGGGGGGGRADERMDEWEDGRQADADHGFGARISMGYASWVHAFLLV